MFRRSHGDLEENILLVIRNIYASQIDDHLLKFISHVHERGFANIVKCFRVTDRQICCRMHLLDVVMEKLSCSILGMLGDKL